MSRMMIIFFDCIFRCFPDILSAQTTNQFSGWLAAFGRVELKNRFSLHVESQLRSTDNIEHIQALIFRAGLNYNLKSNQIISSGYAFISGRRTVNGVSGYAPEDRI